MVRCYITGVDLSLENAWVLDISRARRYRQKLAESIEVLDRYIEDLGTYRIPNQDSEAKRKRRYRKLVSQEIAEAISKGLGSTELFVPFADYRNRQRLGVAERLLRHPVYGADFAQLTKNEQLDVIQKSASVANSLFPSTVDLSSKARNALFGACLMLRDESVQGIARTIRRSVEFEKSLEEIGIASDEVDALLHFLKEKPRRKK